MKVGLSLPNGAFFQGQSVRGQVVGNTDRGSMLLLNGILARADKSLPVGSQVSGTIGDSGSAATLLLGDETASLPGSVSGTAGGPGAAFLNKLGLPETADGQATLDAMREFGLQTTPENAKGVRDFLLQRGLPLTPGNLQAAALIFARRLPHAGFAAALKYLAGHLKFGALLKGLSPEALSNLQKEWSAGNLFKRLSDLAGNFKDQEAARLAAGLPFNELSDALSFQECLSGPADSSGESNLYFSWPVFWQQQEVPDTLEGEAFYPPKDRDDLGFSLRVQVTPPQLGPMEIGLHRLKKSLWIHFSTNSEVGSVSLTKSFPVLEARLSAKGWQEIRLSSGPLTERHTFLSSVSGPPSNGRSISAQALRFDRRF